MVRRQTNNDGPKTDLGVKYAEQSNSFACAAEAGRDLDRRWLGEEVECVVSSSHAALERLARRRSVVLLRVRARDRRGADDPGNAADRGSTRRKLSDDKECCGRRDYGGAAEQ